jgi:hypothetical protein
MILRWQDPTFLETMAPLATRVRITWGGTTTKDLELRPVR